MAPSVAASSERTEHPRPTVAISNRKRPAIDDDWDAHHAGRDGPLHHELLPRPPMTARQDQRCAAARLVDEDAPMVATAQNLRRLITYIVQPST
jgi:hypothetical protein